MFVDLVNSEDVLKAVQARGPAIPMDIRKFLSKGDSITIGAALSTLLSKGLVKCTNVKIGGSPFYYVRGQENKLELLNKYLNDKDKRVFEELRQQKVMKDSNQEPLTRVSLRNIPDFAKKLELTRNEEIIIYWRWYMISEEDAINMIRGETQRKEIQEPETQEPETQEPEAPQQPETQTTENEIQEPEEKQEETPQEPKQEQKTQEAPKKEEKITQKKQTPEKVEEQKELEEEIPDYDDEFFQQIKSFFQENQIEIKKAKLIRKGSDYEFIVKMKTPFGETEYFCKAKSKKKCNEGDLSSAYLQGQNKRMPTVFITTGEITKKAKTTAKQEYKGLLIKEL